MALKVCQAAAIVPVEDNSTVEVFFPFFEKKTEPGQLGQALEWCHLPWDTTQPLDPLIQFLYCKSNPWKIQAKFKPKRHCTLLQAYINILSFSSFPPELQCPRSPDTPDLAVKTMCYRTLGSCITLHHICGSTAPGRGCQPRQTLDF